MRRRFVVAWLPLGYRLVTCHLPVRLKSRIPSISSQEATNAIDWRA
jgi:hypothetical protein